MATDDTTMQTTQKPPAGTPCRIDLPTTDAGRARSALFTAAPGAAFRLLGPAPG